MPLIRSRCRPLVRLLLTAAVLGTPGCSGSTEPPAPEGATTALVTFTHPPTDQEVAALEQRGAVERRRLVSAHGVVLWSTTPPDSLAKVAGVVWVLDFGPVADPQVEVSLHFKAPLTQKDIQRVQQVVGHPVSPLGESDVGEVMTLSQVEQLDGWDRIEVFQISRLGTNGG